MVPIMHNYCTKIDKQSFTCMNGYATDLVVVVVLTLLSWSDLLLWWGWFFAWCLLFCRSRVWDKELVEDDVKFEVAAWWECIVLAADDAVVEVDVEVVELVPLKLLPRLRRLFPNAAADTYEADVLLEFRLLLEPPRLWLEGLNEVIVCQYLYILGDSIYRYTNQDYFFLMSGLYLCLSPKVKNYCRRTENRDVTLMYWLKEL